MAATDAATLAKGVLARDKATLSQALNLVENRRVAAQDDVAALLTALGAGKTTATAHRVGLTGPPGVGKSTLASAVVRGLRTRNKTVGVIAVDPSSVISGGSLLGDRARMTFDPSDRGIFVRSLATAGALGGLSYAVNSAVRVLERAYDTVIIETTGVGQTETDILDVADTVCLVIQPGSGDTLQFLKAGIMEIPDILVVNKADHQELAERAVADLKGALRSTQAATANTADSTWEPPVLATSARDERGIAELIDQLEAHRQQVAATLQEDRRRGEIHWTLQLFVRQHGEHGVASLGGHDALLDQIETALRGGAHPLACAAQLSAAFMQAHGQG